MGLINAFFVSLFEPGPTNGVLINAFFFGRVDFWGVVAPVC